MVEDKDSTTFEKTLSDALKRIFEVSKIDL